MTRKPSDGFRTNGFEGPMLNYLRNLFTGVAFDPQENAGAPPPSPADCARPARGPSAARLPNVVVHTHENRKALFYDDLLRGKIVVVHCMTTRDQESSSTFENLARV